MPWWHSQASSNTNYPLLREGYFCIVAVPVDPKWDQGHFAADAGAPHGFDTPMCEMGPHQCGRRIGEGGG